MDTPQPPNNDSNWERKTLEKLVFAALDEQRARRRWGIAFKLLGFVYLLVVLVRLVLGIDRRQALEVAGDSGQVLLGHVLHAVYDHVAHTAEHRAAITAAGLEELHQLFLAPTYYPQIFLCQTFYSYQ